MQRILKLKNNLLTKAITSTEVSPQGLLRDTKFVLYCFRHYKYVDNDFNLKISNIILNNLHKYENSADKSRAMSLFVQVHLLNSLKISPSQSQVLLDNLQNTSEIPNLRWLINMGVIFQNSDINNPLLWKIIEQHYLNASSSFKTEVTPEELLKLAFIMSSVQKYSPPLWKALVSDIIGREETFNSSQRVMLFKSLAKINSEALFDQDFILTKFKPFMNSLIDAILKKKELLSLRELVGLLTASDEVGLLNEHILSEVEAQLFEKPALLSKKDVYGLMKIYTKTIHTKERKEFLRSIRKVLLSKFDKKISTEDANNFNFINNYLHKMNIIPTQEYNEPYSQFIIDDKFEIFEQLFVSRMKSSSMVEVMNFSFLVQGQLSKYILQLSPQTFLKLFNFLELRGEISETFLKLAFESCKKYLRPVHEKYLKEQVYAYLVHIKYDTQYSKGLKAQSLARNTIQNLKDLNDSEVTEKVLKFVSQNEAELPIEFVNLIKEYYKGTMDKLREETLYELLSLAKEDDLKDYAFREKLEEYFAHNFKYMNVLALCKSYHLIKIIMSKEYTKLAAQTINQKRLTLKEIDYLTRKLDVMTPEIAQHIQECFKANKEGITWRSVEALGRIMLRVFKAGQKFDEKFIKELLGMLSAYQGYFNQKTLDKLIGAYGEINEKQAESQKISE